MSTDRIRSTIRRQGRHSLGAPDFDGRSPHSVPLTRWTQARPAGRGRRSRRGSASAWCSTRCRSPCRRPRSPPSSARRAAASRPSCASSTGCTSRSPAPRWPARSTSTARTSTPPGQRLTDVRKQIGMVFQKPNPFPAMSIADNVAAGLALTSTKVSRSRPGRAGRGLPDPGRAVGRGEGPAATSRVGALRRPAAAAVHRPGPRRRARRCC